MKMIVISKYLQDGGRCAAGRRKEESKEVKCGHRMQLHRLLTADSQPEWRSPWPIA